MGPCGVVEDVEDEGTASGVIERNEDEPKLLDSFGVDGLPYP